MASAVPAHIKVRSQNSFLMDVTKEIPSLEGHLFALPILFVNLGGEMIYVIEHRLKAQGLVDRQQKVMEDVIGTVFRPRIIDELFKPQHLLSDGSMRQLFQKLAHASIMSLNQDSMDKLLDLMFMTVKYQIFACKYPTELIYCTLNHLDYMKELVTHAEPILSSLRKVYNHIERTFCRMDPHNLIVLRNTVLRFFQDRRTRLSIFLYNGTQREEDGLFRIPREFEISRFSHTSVPGDIMYFKTVKTLRSIETTEYKRDMFHPGAIFQLAPEAPQTTSYDIARGNRGTQLGTNVFVNYKGGHTSEGSVDRQGSLGRSDSDFTRNAAGAAEMAMLARILGSLSDTSGEKDQPTLIELDFMEDEDLGGKPRKIIRYETKAQIHRVELQKSAVQEIDLGLNELAVSDNAKDFDLLAEMDKAVGKY